MKKLNFLRFTTVALSFILFSFQVNAQQRLITGIVENADGNSVPSATVTVAETKEATTTDDQGRFSIKAATGQHLEISSVGYRNYSFSIGKKMN